MIIQINTDKNVRVRSNFKAELDALLSEELHRFSEHISRLEVHFSDENGNKQGPDDKKCLIEARVDGRLPIAVSDNGDNYEIAVNGAIDKLKAKLDTIFGKLRNH